jgi:curved DNA-binding protein CbpA
MKETRRSDAYEASTMNTHYDVLGVPRSASEEAIRAAFHGAAKACHPDLNAGDPVAEQKLKHIIDAYDVLKNPERRAAYDELLTEGRRALARRLATSAVATLAGGAVVVLGVSLLSSQPYQQVASVPSSLAPEWERVEASGDAKASAPSSHSNASEAIKAVGREEPQEPVGATTTAAVQEEPQDLAGATAKAVVHEEPAAQNPEAVTTKVAIHVAPTVRELEGYTKSGHEKSGHEEPAARKLTPATALKRLAKGHDPARPATAEIRSPAFFGVAF